MRSEEELKPLLAPFLGDRQVPDQLFSKLGAYLELLQRWNARTNLTAIRDGEGIVTRHFGESLFAGRILEELGLAQATLLDFGSGAGFPGLPIQLLLPNARVTLGESQGKKAAFLREVVRELELHTEVWAGRVEELAAGRTFDVVAMRAVDDMKRMQPVASSRLATGGVFLTFTSATDEAAGVKSFPIPGRLASYVQVQSASMFHVEHL